MTLKQTTAYDPLAQQAFEYQAYVRGGPRDLAQQIIDAQAEISALKRAFAQLKDSLGARSADELTIFLKAMETHENAAQMVSEWRKLQADPTYSGASFGEED